MLLKNEWTDNEIKPRAEKYLEENPFKRRFEWLFWNAGILDSIKNISINIGGREFDSIYHATYNELEIQYKIGIERQIRESLCRVPYEIVLSAAKAGVKEAIPLIRNELASGNQHYDKQTAELALAIFGDSLCRQNIFDQHKQLIKKQIWNENDAMHDYFAMLLIGTQESIRLLADWMDTTREYQQYREGDEPIKMFYFSALPVPRYLMMIQNKDFKEGYVKVPDNGMQPRNSSYYYVDYYVSAAQIQFIKQWMLANKGKYKFE